MSYLDPQSNVDSTSNRPSNRSSNRRGDVIAADAIVIGAGIAGLTAAAMLAKEGRRVAVLERDVHPGGCAAGFSQEGYRFAVGATVAMGFEQGGLHQRIYQMLGLTPRYVAVNPAIRVHLADRKAWVMTERDAWQRELERAFPGRDLAAKQVFWHNMARLARGLAYAAKRFPVMPFKHPWDVIDTARAAHPALLPVFANLHRTVAELMADINDPYHRAFVDGQLLDAMQTTADHCVAPNGALALDIYRYGCQYKIGGLETIAQDLADYVHAQGGNVFYSTLAKEIAVDSSGQRVQGVVTNRAQFEAPVVISAVPLANTATLLTSQATSKVTSNLPQRADAQPEMWGAFTLYLGVDERALPKDVHFYEQVTDLDTHRAAGNFLVSISPAWDRSRSPEGKRAITVSTHVDAAKWLEFARDKEVYQQEKQRFETILLDQIEQALPNVRAGIEVMRSGSPRTFYNFTRRSGGTVGGIPQTQAAANFAAPSHRSDVHGLYLAGDTVFPGQGTLGVSVSGYNAARSAGRFLRRAPPKPPKNINVYHTANINQTTQDQTTQDQITQDQTTQESMHDQKPQHDQQPQEAIT